MGAPQRIEIHITDKHISIKTFKTIVQTFVSFVFVFKSCSNTYNPDQIFFKKKALAFDPKVPNSTLYIKTDA